MINPTTESRQDDHRKLSACFRDLADQQNPPHHKLVRKACRIIQEGRQRCFVAVIHQLTADQDLAQQEGRQRCFCDHLAPSLITKPPTETHLDKLHHRKPSGRSETAIWTCFAVHTYKLSVGLLSNHRKPSAHQKSIKHDDPGRTAHHKLATVLSGEKRQLLNSDFLF